MTSKRAVCGAVLLAVGATHAPAAHGVRIDWAVDAGVEHNTNVGMEETSPRSQDIVRAGLGFTVTEDSSALRLLLTGRTDYQHYQHTYSDRLDRVLTHKWLGTPILLVLMYLVFNLVQTVSAPYLDWIDGVIGGPVSRWASVTISLGHRR